MSKLIDKKATVTLLVSQRRQFEADLQAEREKARTLRQSADAATARCVDLEYQLGLVVDLMEHLQ